MPDKKYECLMITNYQKEKEFWVQPTGCNEITIVKKGKKEYLDDGEGHLYLIEGRFGVNDMNEIGPIAGHGGIIKALLPVEEGAEGKLKTLKKDLAAGKKMNLKDVTATYEGRMHPVTLIKTKKPMPPMGLTAFIYPTAYLSTSKDQDGEYLLSEGEKYYIRDRIPGPTAKAILPFIDNEEPFEVMMPSPEIAYDKDDEAFVGSLGTKAAIMSGNVDDLLAPFLIRKEKKESAAGMNGNDLQRSLAHAYIREYAKRVKESDSQRAKSNTALTIRTTPETEKAGLKRHLIFGLEDNPKLRKDGDRLWLDMDRVSAEVLSVDRLTGMNRIKAYIDRHGREICQMMASDPSFDEKVFVYDDSDEAMDELSEKMAGRYLMNENPLLQEPWGVQHTIKPDSLFIVHPDPDGSSPVARLYDYDGTADERWEKYGLSILRPTCLSGYDRSVGLVVYSAYKATGKKVMDAIASQVTITDRETGEKIPTTVQGAIDLDSRRMKELQEESVMQTMSSNQWKALKSWLKAPEDSRRHTLMKADISDEFFQDILKDAESDPDADGMPIHIAARFLSYMMLTLIQGNTGRNTEIFFILKEEPSDALKALDEEVDRNGHPLPQKRTGDILAAIAENEMHALLLPDTPAGNLDTSKLEELGLKTVQGDEEKEWLELFLSQNQGFVDSLFPKDAKKLKEEEDTAQEGRKEWMPTTQNGDITWNDLLIVQHGSDILANGLFISPEMSDDTVMTIRNESPLSREFSVYGTPDAEGWNIALSGEIPLEEKHAEGMARLLEDHVIALMELRRLSEAEKTDISVGWNGEAHRPAREEDPIAFTTTAEADDSIEDDMKEGEGLASLVCDGRLECRFIRKPELGITLNLLTSPPDYLFDGLEYLSDTPDILMMKAIGQNPSRTAFKRMMGDLERFELRTDAVETVEAVLESNTDLKIPGLSPMDHPVEITAPKGTLFALVEDVVLLPNGKKPPKAYVSIWSSDMKGKYKAVLDRIPEELERRISVLLMMMRSDEKILEVIESLPDGRNGRSAAASGGKKQNGTRSVKTVSLTREFRHRIMREKTEHTPVPRSTEGKILADVSVRKHLRLQPYGPGRSMRKLITIESYAKKMFVNPGVQTTKVIR